MTIRVHNLAKELGLSSKELISHLKQLKVDVKGHMSSLDDDTAQLVRDDIKEKLKKKVEQKEKDRLDKLKLLRVNFPMTVKDLSVKLQLKPSELIKHLMQKNIFATINQNLDEKAVRSIGENFGFRIEKLPTLEEQVIEEHSKADIARLVSRPPVVTFMGHVDHGKTSLLEAIRDINLTDKEVGGITQHIGAYKVEIGKGSITFLDTPGHEAFTAMRARGASATDIVVLVVAADDGVMPQTEEAIDHAKAAGAPIVVAINKCDLENINIDKVKKQLAQLGLTSEDWGGKTITVNVSAKTKKGISELLEMLLLQAEVLELKAETDRFANGVVIEGRLSKGTGPTATVLVKSGTLKTGNTIICGNFFGKIRSMRDDVGKKLDKAGPSCPVEITGLSGVPLAGEIFYIVEDERKAREIISQRQLRDEQKAAVLGRKISLEDLAEKIKEGRIKELELIIKADVQGSLEALRDELLKIDTKELRLNIIHGGVGDINESDIMLAVASNAVVLGFGVKTNSTAEILAKEEGIDVRTYRIIYEAVEDIRKALEGMLEPKIEEVFSGKAEVKQVFKVSRIGTIAGCIVIKGTIKRNAPCRLIRDTKEIFKGNIDSLKRFKDDAREVKEGIECGITINFGDIKANDIIEAYEIKKTARRL